jgi:Xaa-Pro aminopeptidase
LPLEYRIHSWWQDGKKSWFPKGRVASDDGAYGTLNLKEDIAALRWSLTKEEAARFRRMGKLSGEAMAEAAHRVRRGWTEVRIAAELAGAIVKRGLEPSVVLVGADERLKRFRHPIPKPNRVKTTAMLVICAGGGGLISNVTRLVHFGKIPAELRKRHAACLQVECAMWAASRPGVEAGEVFRVGVAEYARQGYPGEWQKHHQGGPTGYEPRDYLGTPTERRKLVVNQALAWNPSITGAKTEDTILTTEKGVEVLTPTPNWPMLKVAYDGRTYLRPDILQIRPI